jgi:hypothetical protein
MSGSRACIWGTAPTPGFLLHDIGLPHAYGSDVRVALTSGFKFALVLCVWYNDRALSPVAARWHTGMPQSYLAFVENGSGWPSLTQR